MKRQTKLVIALLLALAFLGSALHSYLNPEQPIRYTYDKATSEITFYATKPLEITLFRCYPENTLFKLSQSSANTIVLNENGHGIGFIQATYQTLFGSQKDVEIEVFLEPKLIGIDIREFDGPYFLSDRLEKE